jgi:hypothetical protein
MDELEKARKAWGEELLLQRESAIQEMNGKIAQLEYEVRDLRETAKKLTHQNLLFKEQYPLTAYASEIIELKITLDQFTLRQANWDNLNHFRVESNNQLTQQLDNAEDYINELYRLNPGLCLPNGKRFEQDPDA